MLLGTMIEQGENSLHSKRHCNHSGEPLITACAGQAPSAFLMIISLNPRGKCGCFNHSNAQSKSLKIIVQVAPMDGTIHALYVVLSMQHVVHCRLFVNQRLFACSMGKTATMLL